LVTVTRRVWDRRQNTKKRGKREGGVERVFTIKKCPKKTVPMCQNLLEPVYIQGEIFPNRLIGGRGA